MEEKRLKNEENGKVGNWVSWKIGKLESEKLRSWKM
jgi:hypothetical protein